MDGPSENIGPRAPSCQQNHISPEHETPRVKRTHRRCRAGTLKAGTAGNNLSALKAKW